MEMKWSESVMVESGGHDISSLDCSVAYKPLWVEGYERILRYPYSETEDLKKDIVNAIWNDERLLREDLSDIAHKILYEIKRG